MELDDSTLSAAEIEALARRIDRPVVLVGMMGVGKTSIGRKLAALLHVPFVDADEEIEQAAQMTISEIFAQFGEEYFRDGERRVIARLIDGPGTRRVIATGGGAFVNPETRALIRGHDDDDAPLMSIVAGGSITVAAEEFDRRKNRVAAAAHPLPDGHVEIGQLFKGKTA